jgi:hypothetical protein
MKRVGQIFVMLLVIAALIAPRPIFCASIQQAGHACCAAQAELSASCCQSDAAPKTAIPSASSDQSNSQIGRAALAVSLAITPQLALSRPRSNIKPPILLPATILRT